MQKKPLGEGGGADRVNFYFGAKRLFFISTRIGEPTLRKPRMKIGMALLLRCANLRLFVIDNINVYMYPV